MSAEASSGTGTRRGFIRQLLSRPLALGSLCVVALVIVACLAAPVLAPYDPLTQDLSHLLETPTWAHPLGTDALGRDILSRLLYGGQSALLGVAVAFAVWIAIGVPVGLVAGYIGGAVDRVISTIVDLMMALPSIIIVLAALAMFDKSMVAAMVTLGVLASAGLVRVVRAAALSLREELYVLAAQVSGVGIVRILFRHVLPGLRGPLVVQAALLAGGVLVVQVGLGFLGLGMPPPNPTWGNMVGDAAKVLSQSSWMLVPTGGVIAVMIMAFGLIGDAARDTMADTRRGHRRSSGSRQRRTEPRRPVDATALLDVDDLTVSFGTDVVVDHVSFTIDPGEIVGLVGESGSGKTMTSLALLGLLPDGADLSAARMSVAGIDLISSDRRTWAMVRGRTVAYVSQEPMVSLDPLFTIGDLFDEVLRAHDRKLSRKERSTQAEQLLAQVRLPDPRSVLHSYPFQLSGGMAQRVAIAVALAGGPRLLVADEPTTALDVTVQAEILDLMRTLREERAMAILLVTHDLGVVADLCERVLVMQEGRIVEQGDVDGLFAAPQHDYTRELIHATPTMPEMTV